MKEMLICINGANNNNNTNMILKSAARCIYAKTVEKCSVQRVLCTWNAFSWYRIGTPHRTHLFSSADNFFVCAVSVGCFVCENFFRMHSLAPTTITITTNKNNNHQIRVCVRARACVVLFNSIQFNSKF